MIFRRFMKNTDLSIFAKLLLIGLIATMSLSFPTHGQENLKKSIANKDISKNVLLEVETFRVARPTDNLEALKPFYIKGLGLKIIDQFSGHDNISGIVVGQKGWPYHLEFTHTEGHIVGKAPTEDNVIVFYMPNLESWQLTVDRMRAAGFDPVKSLNPYWDLNGLTFEDPDGYRVVLYQKRYTP